MRLLPPGILLVSTLSAQVKFTHEKDRVIVTIDTRPFGTLYFGKEANKPFFHPLTTPTVIAVTRAYPVDKSPEPEPTDQRPSIALPASSTSPDRHRWFGGN